MANGPLSPKSARERDRENFPFETLDFNLFDYVLGEETNLSTRDFIGNSKTTNDCLDEVLKEGALYPADQEEPEWLKDVLKEELNKKGLGPAFVTFKKLELQKRAAAEVTNKQKRDQNFFDVTVIQNTQKDGGVFTPTKNICKHCKRSFEHKTQLIAHSLLESHVKCLFCDETFPCIGLWRAHCRDMHMSKTEIESTCIKCGKEVCGRRRHNLLCHYAIHLEQNYRCVFCDGNDCNQAEFKTAKGLASHLERHHSKECDEWKNDKTEVTP